MAQQQISAGSINAAIAALRFFFNVTLERPDLVRHLTSVNKPRKAPVVLSQEEVARLLEAASGLKSTRPRSASPTANAGSVEEVARNISWVISASFEGHSSDAIQGCKSALAQKIALAAAEPVSALPGNREKYRERRQNRPFLPPNAARKPRIFKGFPTGLPT